MKYLWQTYPHFQIRQLWAQPLEMDYYGALNDKGRTGMSLRLCEVGGRLPQEHFRDFQTSDVHLWAFLREMAKPAAEQKLTKHLGFREEHVRVTPGTAS